MAVTSLGQISAIFKGTSAPTNTNMIWQDTSVTPHVFKSYDSTSSSWVALNINIGGAVTVASDDKVVIQDTSDSDNYKTVTAQSIADLGSGTTINNDADNRVTTALGNGELNAEANFTFNGSLATITGDLNVSNLSAASSDEFVSVNSSGLLNNSGITFSSGTYVPEITGSVSNPTISYSTQAGNYYVIGDLVYVNFAISISSYSGGSGQVRISLPFTCETSNSTGVGSIHTRSVDMGAGYSAFAFQVQNSQSFGAIYEYGDNSAASSIILTTDLSTSTLINGSVSYIRA